MKYLSSVAEEEFNLSMANADESESFEKHLQSKAMDTIKYLDENSSSFLEFGLTIQYLDMILNEENLTPIDNNEDDWIEYDGFKNIKCFYHKRRPSLVKYMINEEVHYLDDKVFTLFDDQGDIRFEFLIAKWYCDRHPITFPYNPRFFNKPIFKFKETYEEVDNIVYVYYGIYSTEDTWIAGLKGNNISDVVEITEEEFNLKYNGNDRSA